MTELVLDTALSLHQRSSCHREGFGKALLR